ncbi:CAP domain-containing protein [Roseobacter sp. YSTF-M11]|uniref:CAP domain-containing protein n=1 Tax=Roseobacter insulae TaxID=2859783 RepID=A0A9X1FTJ0_9RHOB|nr:CAP domain-containing protein [Roseobacter insulae]MBW4707529.1 CAP domain-containing protein [Roseobacter insulae]
MKALLIALILLGGAGAGAADTAATEALNSFRAANNRAALSYSDLLETAALRHARDMAAWEFFDHRGSDGSDVAQRVSRTGYRWCVVAENIAKGQATLQEVMSGWANSRGHRRNMLSREVTEFALVEAPGRIWVMVLAAPGC